MLINDSRISQTSFFQEREEVLKAWPTGKDVNINEAIEYHKNLPEGKIFSKVMKNADDNSQTLIQPRAGVALLGEHIQLLQYLQQEADLLPTTIDAYTRQNQYIEAEKG